MPLGPLTTIPWPVRIFEVPAQLLVAFQPLVDRAAGDAVFFQVLFPFLDFELLDPAGDRGEVLLVDPEPLGFVLVAEEEVDVLPAVALVGRRLGAVEAELLGVDAVRVVAVEQLHLAGAGVAFGQSQGSSRGSRRWQLAALEVVEDLDRHRRVVGAEPVAFLGHPAEQPLRVGDPFEVDDRIARLLRRQLDDRVAEREPGRAPAARRPRSCPAWAAAWKRLRRTFAAHYRDPGPRVTPQAAALRH